MIKDDELISVRNRNRGTTGYTLDNNFHRKFNVNETKKIPFSELKALQVLPGGDVILRECLVVENKEALELLNMEVEPEYFYNEEQIRDILLNGSIDAFADFLDFAPEGAIEIAKDIAVKEELPDTRKREMISNKTGFNINNAIMINRIMEEDSPAEKEAPKQRRVKAEEKKETSTGRRTSLPDYKVVKK